MTPHHIGMHMATQIRTENQATLAQQGEGLSLLPRRAFGAAAVSALAAAATVAVIWLGALGAPTTQTFQFSRNTTFANGELVRLQGFLAPAAQDDKLQIVILGHTGQNGDATANLELSVNRAEVAAKMAKDMGIEATRISTTGLGGSAPSAKTDGQSDRAFQAGLARVDVTLRVQR